MTFLGTTISIVLTFGTAAWLDHRQQIKNRRQTAMMVLSNIEDFVWNMRYIDSTLVKYDYEKMTDGECVAAILDMKGVKFFIDDFTEGFVPYFESCIDHLSKFNSNNMALIGVTREELTEFIKVGEQTTE